MSGGARVQLTHCAFSTPDLDQTVDFYCRYLAMRRVRLREDPVRHERVAWLAPAREDAPILVCIELKAAPNPGLRDHMARHLGFSLADRAAVDALYDRLLADGWQPTPPVYLDANAGYLTMVRDPSGLWVEISCEQDVSPGNWD